MNNYETKPLQVNTVTIGNKETKVQPFENHTLDFAKINEYLVKNPAVRQHVIPDAMVSSCSECCMDAINGQPNLLGRMFRKSRGRLGCHLCPVLLASEHLPARDSNGNYLKNGDGKTLSEADVVRMAEDGTT